jgi:hypothetical protein
VITRKHGRKRHVDVFDLSRVDEIAYCRAPKLIGMLNSKGTIRIHNYNGTSIKIKQKHEQPEIRQNNGSETRNELASPVP